jgi:hypothetical protein
MSAAPIPAFVAVPATLIALIGICARANAEPAPVDAVAVLIAAEAARHDPRVGDALDRIDGTGRRLLALRSYLRAGAGLSGRWSWSSEQIAAYEASPEGRELREAIRRVQEAFAHANPGYELWVNPQLRSLDVQLERWNSNDSIAAAADNLQRAATSFVQSPGSRALDAAGASRAFRELLIAHVPDPTPTLAAPGLSPHGQMRAVDFHVQKGDEIVAGTTAATVASEWDAAGWTVRLQEAVRASGAHFSGPLQLPQEPWHYTYEPRER